jgi:hypothetical protein
MQSSSGALYGQRHIPQRREALVKPVDHGRHLVRQQDPRGVGEIHGACAGCNGRLQRPAEEIEVGAGGVLRRELHVAAVRGRRGYEPGDKLRQHGRLGLTDVFHLHRRYRHADEEPGLFRVHHGPPGPFKRLLRQPRGAGEDTVLYQRGNGSYQKLICLVSAQRRKLDDVHTQPAELPGKLQLFLEAEGIARSHPLRGMVVSAI